MDIYLLFPGLFLNNQIRIHSLILNGLYANIAKGTVYHSLLNCTFYCYFSKILSLQAKTFAPFLHLFQLYPLIEFAKQLPEPIGYIF